MSKSPFKIRPEKGNKPGTMPRHWDILANESEDSIITVWDSLELAETIVKALDSLVAGSVSKTYARSEVHAGTRQEGRQGKRRKPRREGLGDSDGEAQDAEGAGPASGGATQGPEAALLPEKGSGEDAGAGAAVLA